MKTLTQEQILKAAQSIAGKIIASSSLERQIYEQLVLNGIEWAISQMQDQWVAVSERLPDVGVGCCQVIIEDSRSGERFRMAANFDGDWILPYDPAQCTSVTHWAPMLPLPEPPKQESEVSNG